MNRATWLVLVILSLTAAIGDDKVAPTVDNSLAVSIAVPRQDKYRSLNESDHFHVLIRNKSAKPVRLWTVWNSWGYDNLSFDQIDVDGPTTRITKLPTAWSKNYPDWLELLPGETHVLNVDFYSSDDWDNVPLPSGMPKLIKLRAVYEVRPDKESRKEGVWTGKIASEPDTYAIWNNRNWVPKPSRLKTLKSK